MDVFFSVVAIVALVASLAALGVALLALQGRRGGGSAGRRTPHGADGLPEDVLGLRQEVAALRLDVANSLRNLTVMRYDAFGDVGGKLSWTAALLDDHGSGLLFSSIHGRSEARTYAKSIAEWSCDQPLSPEEEEALTHARRDP